MAASSALPVRSISLPSRVHPTSVKVEAALNHLRVWQVSASSAVPIGAETFQIGLIGLAELYNNLQEFIQSPLTQRELLRYQNGELVEDALDGSVTLLDTCDSARNVLFTMKQHVQTLQSALRRRGRDLSIESNVNAYISFRKKAKKEIAKCVGSLKKMERKAFFSEFLDGNQHLEMIVQVLREATSFSISIFQSLLLFLSTPTMKIKPGGFTLISKLILKRSSSSGREQKIINEVESVDLAVYALHEHLRSCDASTEVQMLLKMLETLNNSIDSLETGLDSMFRCLVQNRVSFLNILTNHH